MIFFPHPFTTEGEQKGLVSHTDALFILALPAWNCFTPAVSDMSVVVAFATHRSAGYLFAVGQPIPQDCKVGRRVGRQSLGKKFGRDHL